MSLLPLSERGYPHVAVYRLRDRGLFVSRRAIFDSEEGIQHYWGRRIADQADALVAKADLAEFLDAPGGVPSSNGLHPDAHRFLEAPPLEQLPEELHDEVRALVSWHRDQHPLALLGREEHGDFKGTASSTDGSRYEVTITHRPSKQCVRFQASWHHLFRLEHFLSLAYHRLRREDAYDGLRDANVSDLRRRHKDLVGEVRRVFRDHDGAAEQGLYHHGPNPDFLDFRDHESPLGYLDRGFEARLADVAFHVGHHPATPEQVRSWTKRLYDLHLERALRAIHAYVTRTREVLDWATDPDASRYHSHVTITLYQEGLLCLAQWLHTILRDQDSNDRALTLLEDVEDLLVRQVAPPLRLEAVALERLLCILDTQRLTAADAMGRDHCPIDWDQAGLQVWMEDRLSQHGLYKRVP